MCYWVSRALQKTQCPSLYQLLHRLSGGTARTWFTVAQRHENVVKTNTIWLIWVCVLISILLIVNTVQASAPHLAADGLISELIFGGNISLAARSWTLNKMWAQWGVPNVQTCVCMLVTVVAHLFLLLWSTYIPPSAVRPIGKMRETHSKKTNKRQVDWRTEEIWRLGKMDKWEWKHEGKKEGWHWW